MDPSPNHQTESQISEQTLEMPSSTSDGDDQRVEDAEEDRISNLPDSVIGLILSKLPTKSAIATAVLSTKWRYSFYLIPNPRINILDSKHASGTIHPSFVNFLSHLFNHILPQFSTIDEFSLVLEQNYGNKRIVKCLSTAPTCNVRSLQLRFPGIFLGIPSLEVLRPFSSICSLNLYSLNRQMVGPKSTLLFPNLTSIVMYGVIFVDMSSFARSLAACPSLTDLEMVFLGFYKRCDLRVIHISVPSLRKLIMRRCRVDRLQLMFETPKLESLGFYDNTPRIFSVKNPGGFHSLDTAAISVRSRDSVPELASTGIIAKLLAECSSVTTLSFSVSILALDQQATFPMSTFIHLKELRLGIFNIAGWEILPKFLQYSPVLRVLHFPEEVFTNHLECYERFHSLPYFVPTCLSSHLSEISFLEFKGAKDEVKLVKYFLSTARVLERMKICFGDSSLSHEEMIGVQKDMLTSPICSINCQVDIVLPKYAH